MSAELAFNRSQDVDYGVAQEVAPGIRRIVANNPGPYTFLGTNSYIVGSGEVAVIDPGPRDERHLEGDRRRDQGRAPRSYPRSPTAIATIATARAACKRCRRRDRRVRADRHGAGRRRAGA